MTVGPSVRARMELMHTALKGGLGCCCFFRVFLCAYRFFTILGNIVKNTLTVCARWVDGRTDGRGRTETDGRLRRAQPATARTPRTARSRAHLCALASDYKLDTYIRRDSAGIQPLRRWIGSRRPSSRSEFGPSGRLCHAISLADSIVSAPCPH